MCNWTFACDKLVSGRCRLRTSLSGSVREVDVVGDVVGLQGRREVEVVEWTLFGDKCVTGPSTSV